MKVNPDIHLCNFSYCLYTDSYIKQKNICSDKSSNMHTYDITSELCNKNKSSLKSKKRKFEYPNFSIQNTMFNVGIINLYVKNPIQENFYTQLGVNKYHIAVESLETVCQIYIKSENQAVYNKYIIYE